MTIQELDIQGLFLIDPRVIKDERGYFFESYRLDLFNQKIGEIEFLQDNESKSSYGTIRGLHYQTQPYTQAKLVRVIEGKILDVAVDLRKWSPTLGKHFAVELSADNKKQLFIPRGFAHGFSTLSSTAIVQYKCDNYYNKESEQTILFNDQALGIDWQIKEEDRILSEKDQEGVLFNATRLFN